MINFFRKIRKQLADDNMPLKYMRYAIGEIVLVVVGILIALSINNWNQNIIQNNKFEGLLEQIFHSIYVDKEWQRKYIIDIAEDVDIIDQLLAYDSLTIDPKKLIHILFYLDLNPGDFPSNTNILVQYLDYDSNNENTILLTNALATYNSSGGNFRDWLDGYELERGLKITDQLMKLGLPRPPVAFIYSSLNNFNEIDSTYFNDEEIQKALNIVKTKQFKAALKSLKSKKYLGLESLNNGIIQNNSLIQLIKNYYPNIGLQFKNIGILGTALEFGFDKSIPMKLTDSKNDIWEIDIFLKNGLVKFRDLNNWSHNWGGKQILKGKTEYYGDNIPVKEGNYHIILNLGKSTYEFIKLEN